MSILILIAGLIFLSCAAAAGLIASAQNPADSHGAYDERGDGVRP